MCNINNEVFAHTAVPMRRQQESTPAKHQFCKVIKSEIAYIGREGGVNVLGAQLLPVYLGHSFNTTL